MNKDTSRMLSELTSAGIDYEDALRLRRVAMQLKRWHELECGTGIGYVERDEATRKTFWVESRSGYRFLTPDRETGALKRLSAIMAKYPDLSAYVQTDPRGAALYILRPGDVPEGRAVECCYTNGLAVYK